MSIELFCDIIIVFTPIDNEFLMNENKDVINPKIFSNRMFSKTTAKIKITLNYIGLPINKSENKPTTMKYIAN